jgi:hypothetical protein
MTSLLLPLEPPHHGQPLPFAQFPNPCRLTGIRFPRLAKCTRSLPDQRPVVPDSGDELVCGVDIGSHGAKHMGTVGGFPYVLLRTILGRLRQAFLAPHVTGGSLGGRVRRRASRRRSQSATREARTKSPTSDRPIQGLKWLAGAAPPSHRPTGRTMATAKASKAMAAYMASRLPPKDRQFQAITALRWWTYVYGGGRARRTHHHKTAVPTRIASHAITSHTATTRPPKRRRPHRNNPAGMARVAMKTSRTKNMATVLTIAGMRARTGLNAAWAHTSRGARCRHPCVDLWLSCRGAGDPPRLLMRLLLRSAAYLMAAWFWRPRHQSGLWTRVSN